MSDTPTSTRGSRGQPGERASLAAWVLPILVWVAVSPLTADGGSPPNAPSERPDRGIGGWGLSKLCGASTPTLRTLPSAEASYPGRRRGSPRPGRGGGKAARAR